MRRGNLGKGIMAVAEKEQVCTDIVTMPESQMLEAEEEWGKVREESDALVHTGVRGPSVSESKHRGMRWVQEDRAGSVSDVGEMLGFEEQCQ